MSVHLSNLFWALVQPLNLVLLLVVLGPMMTALGRAHLGRTLVMTGLTIFITISILPIGQLLLLPLENRYAVHTPLPSTVDGIIVLGGGAMPSISTRRNQPTFNNHSERYTKFVELAGRYPDAKLIVAAGPSETVASRATEAEVLRRFFVSMGIPKERVLLESESRNTWENALFARDLIHPKPDSRWLLITTAYHMPRATGVFQTGGWDVVAAPVDFRTSGTVSYASFDALDRITELDTALREWFGLIAYYFMGRTQSILPGP